MSFYGVKGPYYFCLASSAIVLQGKLPSVKVSVTLVFCTRRGRRQVDAPTENKVRTTIDDPSKERPPTSAILKDQFLNACTAEDIPAATGVHCFQAMAVIRK